MANGLMPNAERLLRLHDEATERWHGVEGQACTQACGAHWQPGQPPQNECVELILSQHRANFDLWHQEDEARDPHAAPAQIADVKHAIDALNQRRNDLVEALDNLLSAHLRQTEDSPLHSETPAMIVDRLSIMALKIYHTREETVRHTASEAHRAKNRERLARLMQQRSDLSECLDRLMQEIARGERHFKLYRQMKMYNDPELNPVLYRKGGG